MARRIYRKNEALADLLRKCADKSNKAEMYAALEQLAGTVSDEMNRKFGFIAEKNEAEALDVNPAFEIQEAVLDGDIFSDIFTMTMLGWDEQPMFPMGIVAPGTEGEYVAYTMPSHGKVPHRFVEGDEVTINTYRVANSIDWLIKYFRQARVDVVGQGLQVLRNGFTQKFNDDAWHTIMAAGLDRGLMVYDSAATQGVFTKKLLQLLKVAMMRNGGGNTASTNTFSLTDLYISPEAMEDIRSWTNDDLSEDSRRDMELNAEGTVQRLFGVNLHTLTELGESQKYNNYYTNTLGGSLASSDVELVIGLDKSKSNDFVMPVRGNGIEVMADESMIRSGYTGFWAESEIGFGILDTRAVLLGSF